MYAMPEAFFENSDFAEMEPFFIGFLIVILVVYLIAMVILLVSYVLGSLGMYSIAKRRGIHNPWLAWIPVANTWVLGSISDQYQYVAKGKVRSRRKLLLTLNIIIAVLPAVMSVFAGVAAVMTVGLDASAAMGVLAGAMIIWLILMVLAIIYSVFMYIALYDLYNSCNPQNAVTFLLLSIFVSVTQPFFVFACRNKDLGMPPRKQTQPIVRDIPQELLIQEPVRTMETKDAVPPETAQPAPVAEEPCVAEESDFAEEPSEPTETE